MGFDDCPSTFDNLNFVGSCYSTTPLIPYLCSFQCYYKYAPLGFRGTFSDYWVNNAVTCFNLDGDDEACIETGGTSNEFFTKSSGGLYLNDHVYINWIGNLRGSNNFVKPTNYEGFFNIEDNRWYLVQSGTFDVVSEEMNDVIQEVNRGFTIANFWFGNRDLINAYNSFFWLETRGSCGSDWSCEHNYILESSILKNYRYSGDNFVVTYEDDSFTEFPVFVIDLDAEYYGEPYVGVSCGVASLSASFEGDTITVQSGDDWTGNVMITNAGDYSGGFSLSTYCDNSDVRLLLSSTSLNLGVGESRNINARLSGTNNDDDDLRASCYVRAGSTGSGCSVNEDRLSFDVRVKRTSGSCIDLYGLGYSRCTSNAQMVEVCQANGVWGTQDCGSIGCYYLSDGTAQCRVIPEEETICDDGIDNDGDGLIDEQDPDCGTGDDCKWYDFGCLRAKWEKNWKILSIVVSLITVLIVYLFGTSYLPKKKVKSTWWIILILSLLVGGLVYWVLTVYYWVLIIIGVVWLLLPLIKGLMLKK